MIWLSDKMDKLGYGYHRSLIVYPISDLTEGRVRDEIG